MKKWRNLWCLLLSLAMALALVACSAGNGGGSTDQGQNQNNTANDGGETDGETFVFTDSTGREVELPRNIERVASAGPLANIMLYAVKPEVIVGWSSKPSESAQKYIDELGSAGVRRILRQLRGFQPGGPDGQRPT